MAEFKILSIDGGGIRGVYPAAYLNYFQDRIYGKVYEYFDMIVGTSTGSIIALALALGIDTNTILDLYKKKGRKIFKKRFPWISRGFILPKYSNASLIAELQSLFSKETLLGDCKTRVCIPTIDIINGKTVVRKTRHDASFIHDHRIPAWEIAAASSAAPGFFPAFVDEQSCVYVDGGLWANNPSLVGLAEAKKLGFTTDDIKILSVGTGTKLFHKESWKTKYLGIAGWGTSLVELTFQSQSQGANNTAKYILEDNFIRINHDLPTERKFLRHDKYGLDKLKGVTSLINFAEYKAKETFADINSRFFNNKAPAFVPVL